MGSGTARASTDFATVPSFTVQIPANAASGAGTFTLTIIDDDESPRLTIEDARAGECAGEIVFRVRLDPGTPRRGLALDVSSSWGPSASAAERLWSVGDSGELMGDNGSPASGRVSAELGYAVEVFDRAGVVTPRAGFAVDESGVRTYRVGGTLSTGSPGNFQITAVAFTRAGNFVEVPGQY